MLKLKWEYCECGCHGHCTRTHSLYGCADGKFNLYRGHTYVMGYLLGTYDTFEQADKEAKKDLDKTIKEMMEDVAGSQ